MKHKEFLILFIVLTGILCNDDSEIDETSKEILEKSEIQVIDDPNKKEIKDFNALLPDQSYISYLIKPIYSKNSPGTIYFESGSNILKDVDSAFSNRIDNKRILRWKIPKFRNYFIRFYKKGRYVFRAIEVVLRKSGVFGTKSVSDSNLFFYSPKNSTDIIPFLNKYQRYNHFPNTWDIGRKDLLWKNFKRMNIKFPLDFNYLPETFILPEEKDLFLKKFETDPNLLWIVKPKGLSRGRGIGILTDIDSLPRSSIVSHYIYNPHLINNKKYDMRLYVLVTGFSPLRIYLFSEGLARFASEEYSTDSESISNPYAHLTNFSVNKNSDKFDIENINVNDECAGSTWSLGALKRYFKSNDLDFETVWAKIKDIVIKSILSITEKSIVAVKELTDHKNTLYELYGIDIILDQTFTPWLLEYNVGPSLSISTQLNYRIKTALIASIFNTIGIVPFSHEDEENETPKVIFEEEIYKKNCEESNLDSNKMQCDSPKRNSASYDSSDSESTSEIINYCLDEFSRSGLFQRIFPLKSNIDYYSKFLENWGSENLILWNYLKNSTEDF